MTVKITSPTINQTIKGNAVPLNFTIDQPLGCEKSSVQIWSPDANIIKTLQELGPEFSPRLKHLQAAFNIDVSTLPNGQAYLIVNEAYYDANGQYQNEGTTQLVRIQN